LNFIEILQAGAEFFYAHGRTDMAKLIIAFRSFANALFELYLEYV